MSLKNKKAPEQGPAVPAYIVTFSDMITLLLTFFVLLLSMAEQEKNTGKFEATQESFKQSIAGFGMQGILYSSNQTENYEDRKVNHPIKEESPEKPMPINAAEEQIRRLFSQINENMNVRPSQIKGKLSDLIATEIKFKPNSASLDKNAHRYLSEFCSELKLTMESKSATLYVVGTANDSTGKNKWFVAAQRAEAVVDFLKAKLDDNIPIYSWGTGKPSEWIISTGAKQAKSQILIAIIE